MNKEKAKSNSLIGLLNDRKWYLLLFTLFWIMMVLIRNPFNPAVGFVQEDQAYDTLFMEPIVGLTKGVLVEQHIIGEHNDLSSILYTTGTCNRRNTGTMTIRLKDAETGAVIAEEQKDVAELPNLELVSFRFPVISDSLGKEYILSFSADTEDDEQCIVLMGSHSERLEPVYVNGNQMSLSIRSQLNYHDNSAYPLRLLMFLAVYVLGMLLILFMRGTDARSYLIYASVVGLLYLFIIPFPNPLDESTHFFRSFMISQGNILDDVDDTGEIGGYISDTYKTVLDQDLNWEAFLNDREDWMQEYSTDIEFYRNPYMSSYIPVNHLPGAVGIWLGTHLHLPAIWGIFFGRLITLICYIAMTYVAVRKANYYRNIYFVVAGLPLSLYLAASFSADPLLIGASLMVISICLRYRFDPEQTISLHELFFLLIGVMLIASSKYLIYLPILLVFFLIPKKCFSSRKQYIAEIVLAVLIILVFAATAFWLLKQFNYVEDRNGHVNMGEQIAFLLEHKFTGFTYLVTGFFETLNFNLIRIGIQKPDLFPIMLLLFTAVFDEKPYRFESGKKKIQMSTLFIGISFFVHAFTVGALYLAFTPVGQATTDGVQPRYMLPILPLMMMVLGFCLPAEPKMGKVDKKVALCLLMVCLDVLSNYMMVTFI